MAEWLFRLSGHPGGYQPTVAVGRLNFAIVGRKSGLWVDRDVEAHLKTDVGSMKCARSELEDYDRISFRI